MNKIEELKINYVKKWQRLEARRNNLEERISKWESELKNIQMPGWINMIIEPIAEMMVKKLPERRFEILGPFGICARTSIHFYRKGIQKEKEFDADNCLSICFEPGDLDKGEVRIVNEEINTGRFKQGTIGEMNGMNHPTQEMVNDIDWLLNWAKR